MKTPSSADTRQGSSAAYCMEPTSTTSSVKIVAASGVPKMAENAPAGAAVIEAAIDGEAVPYAFLLKMLFTALTLGAGFKGGEIVPIFFTGVL